MAPKVPRSARHSPVDRRRFSTWSPREQLARLKAIKFHEQEAVVHGMSLLGLLTPSNEVGYGAGHWAGKLAQGRRAGSRN